MIKKRASEGLRAYAPLEGRTQAVLTGLSNDPHDRSTLVPRTCWVQHDQALIALAEPHHDLSTDLEECTCHGPGLKPN